MSIYGHLLYFLSETFLWYSQFAYNSSKAAVSHLTKMMATEFVLKKIPIRVSGIAPGVYVSEMTKARLSQGPSAISTVGLGIQPVPADRPGT